MSFFGEMKKVKIYTTPFCPYCKMVKDLLSKHDVKFEEVNVQEDNVAAREMIRKSGQTAVPVLDIGGKIIVGFDRKKILEALGF